MHLKSVGKWAPVAVALAACQQPAAPVVPPGPEPSRTFSQNLLGPGKQAQLNGATNGASMVSPGNLVNGIPASPTFVVRFWEPVDVSSMPDTADGEQQWLSLTDGYAHDGTLDDPSDDYERSFQAQRQLSQDGRLLTLTLANGGAFRPGALVSMYLHDIQPLSGTDQLQPTVFSWYAAGRGPTQVAAMDPPVDTPMGRDGIVRVTFTRPLDPASVGGVGFFKDKYDAVGIPITTSLSQDRKTLIVQIVRLDPTQYTVPELRMGALKDEDGIHVGIAGTASQGDSAMILWWETPQT